MTSVMDHGKTSESRRQLLNLCSRFLLLALVAVNGAIAATPSFALRLLPKDGELGAEARSCSTVADYLSSPIQCGPRTYAGEMVIPSQPRFAGDWIIRLVPSTDANNEQLWFVDGVLRFKQRHHQEGPSGDLMSPIGSLHLTGTLAIDGQLGGLKADLIIAGGTLTFSGIRGTVSRAQIDNGVFSIDVRLEPSTFPIIMTTAAGPAVARTLSATLDALVSARNPARRGDVLKMINKNLGMTRPCRLWQGVYFFPYCRDTTLASPAVPNEPFPPLTSDDLYVSAAPITVVIDGFEAKVWHASGYRNSEDYQVNFQVPQGVRSGNVRLQVFHGFIPSNEVLVPIQ